MPVPRLYGEGGEEEADDVGLLSNLVSFITRGQRAFAATVEPEIRAVRRVLAGEGLEETGQKYMGEWLTGRTHAAQILASGLPGVDLETSETKQIGQESLAKELMTAAAAPIYREKAGEKAEETLNVLSYLRPSTVMPGLYSESGEGWALQKGGFFDPSGRGAAEFGAGVATDPLTFVPIGKAIKGAYAASKGAPLAGGAIRAAEDFILTSAPMQYAKKALTPLSKLPGVRNLVGEEARIRHVMAKFDESLSAWSKALEDVVSPLVKTPEAIQNFKREFIHTIERPKDASSFAINGNWAEALGDDAYRKIAEIRSGLENTFRQILAEEKAAGIAIDALKGKDALTEYFIHSATPEFKQWYTSVVRGGKKFPAKYGVRPEHVSQLPRQLDTVEDMIRWADENGFYDWAKQKGIKSPEVAVLDPFLATHNRKLRSIKAISAAEYINDAKKLGVSAEYPKGLGSAEETIAGFRQKLSDLSSQGWREAKNPLVEKHLGERVLFPPEIADSLDVAMDVLHGTGAGRDVVTKAMAAWNRVWKPSQTIFWPAFVGRNAISNVYLNMLGGVSDPTHYVRSAVAMALTAKPGSATSRLIKRSLAGGVIGGFASGDLEGALTGAAIGAATVPAGMTIRKYLASQEIIPGMSAQQLIDEASQLGVNSGWFDFELSASRPGAVRPMFERGGVKKALRGVRNTAEGMNRLVEEHARLTHYIAKRAEGLAPEEAARSTFKYLFDYGDLSPVERNYLRHYIPFYTFTRKNIPLQIESFLKHSGKYAAAMRAAGHRGFTEEEEKNLPPWVVAAVKTGNVPGGARVFTGLGLPFENVLQFMQQPGKTLAGSLASPIKGAIEATTGRSLFYGEPLAKRPLSPTIPLVGESILGAAQQAGAADTLEAILQNMPYSRALTTARRAGFAEEQGRGRNERIIESLTGGRVQEFDWQRERMNRMRDQIKRAVEQGIINPVDYSPAKSYKDDPKVRAMLKEYRINLQRMRGSGRKTSK